MRNSSDVFFVATYRTVRDVIEHLAMRSVLLGVGGKSMAIAAGQNSFIYIFEICNVYYCYETG